MRRVRKRAVGDWCVCGNYGGCRTLILFCGENNNDNVLTREEGLEKLEREKERRLCVCVGSSGAKGHK